MISFFPELPPLQDSFVKACRNLATTLIRPTAVEDDRNETFRRPIFDALKNEGLSSLMIPTHWGGKAAGSLAHYCVLTELSRFSASYSITVGVHQMIQAAVLDYGSDDQKRTFLPGLVSGNLLGAFSLSEAGSGSDAGSLTTTAKRISNNYEINGTKLWCSNGSDANLFLVMARTGGPGPKGISAFLVTKDTPGFFVGKKENKLGLKSSSLTELIFENCRIPKSCLLGVENGGFAVALSQLDAGRVGIAATAIGLAQAALEVVWIEGTKGTIDFSEGLRAQWASYFAELQAATALVSLTAVRKDQGLKITALASQCKLLASDLAMKMTSAAVDTLGFSGLLPELGVERMMRDAKALQIVEGTNQIQKLVLGRELDKMVLS
ncbi:MAG: acyl-CoA dehydrogenase family protein [Pseudomonadota bacterium]